MITKRQCWIIWLLSILGALSVLPYVYSLEHISKNSSGLVLFFKTFFYSSIMYGAICWLSYLLLKHVDLDPFPTLTKKNIFQAILSGVLVAFVLIFSNTIIFRHTMLGTADHPPVWTGMLASLYGSINEEVLCRLFLLTLIYFVLRVTFKFQKNLSIYFVWISIILVAVLFGVGHLPAAFSMGATARIEIFRVLFLNGIAGITFGWLYCYKGFWPAVIAHFVADVLIHVVLIL